MRSIFQETGDAEDPTLPFQRRRQKTTHEAVGSEKIITLLLQTIDVLFCRGDPACAGDQENKQLKTFASNWKAPPKSLSNIIYHLVYFQRVFYVKVKSVVRIKDN